MYEQYIALMQQRKKQEAQDLLREFLASFQSDDQKEAWVRNFLANYEDKKKISHFIYTQLVFPVLFAGYQQKDAWSTLWLAKTIQNIYGIDALHEAIGHKSEVQLLKETYALEQSPEIRAALLNNEIRWFRYCEHEWPSGILYGADGATFEECNDILAEVEFAKRLDENAEFEAFLSDFEQKTRQYQERLKKKS